MVNLDMDFEDSVHHLVTTTTIVLKHATMWRQFSKNIYTMKIIFKILRYKWHLLLLCTVVVEVVDKIFHFCLKSS